MPKNCKFYTCHIIFILGKPDPPGKPWLLEESMGCITLVWHPTLFDGGSPITNYIIEKRDLLSSHWTIVNFAAVTDTHYNIGHLVPGLEYEFRVSAENIAGIGLPSPKSDIIILNCREGMEERTCLLIYVNLYLFYDSRLHFF